MNAFADTLFTLLFGWIKAGVQGIWSSVTQGHWAGFFTWLGDHWLILAVFLCLVCTVLDYFVWLVRWRPYLVWKTKLRRFLARVRGQERERKQRFAQGYQGDAMIAAGTGNVPLEYGQRGLEGQGQPGAENAGWGNPAPEVMPQEEIGNPSAYGASPAPNAWSTPQYAPWQGPEAGDSPAEAGTPPADNSPYAAWQPPREGSGRP